jgi:hypothetical protein
MSLRGRGCLQVRPSDNPFFQPVSSDIGKTSNDVPDWKINGQLPSFNTTEHKVDGNFSFLYTRESDTIGSRIKKPESHEVRMLSRTEFLKQRREKFLSELSPEERMQNSGFFNTSDPSPRKSAEDILTVYKHEPKQQDPRYTTSMVSFLVNNG